MQIYLSVGAGQHRGACVWAAFFTSTTCNFDVLVTVTLRTILEMSQLQEVMQKIWKPMYKSRVAWTSTIALNSNLKPVRGRDWHSLGQKKMPRSMYLLFKTVWSWTTQSWNQAAKVRPVLKTISWEKTQTHLHNSDLWRFIGEVSTVFPKGALLWPQRCIDIYC